MAKKLGRFKLDEKKNFEDALLKRLDKLETSLSVQLQLINDGITQLGKDIFKLVSMYLELDLGKHPSFWFNDEDKKLLNFEDAGDRWIIKPKTYLGSDIFARVKLEIAKRGGHYIPAGKDSRFEVKKWLRKKSWVN